MMQASFATTGGRCIRLSVARLSGSVPIRMLACTQAFALHITAKSHVASALAVAGIPQWGRLRHAALGAAQARCISTSLCLHKRISKATRKVTHRTVTLSILLPGCTRYEVLHVTGPLVGHIKQAVASNFYQLKGLKTDQLRLLKVGDDSVSRTPLESTQTMAEAGLLGGDMVKIVVEIWMGTSAAEEILKDSTTPAQVYNLIGRGARSVVDAARKYRGTLAGVSALTGLQARLTAADATSLGITVLRQDASGNMTAGMFDLPTLHVSADLLPKTFDGFARQSQKVLLLPQRMQCAFEAMQAVRDGLPLGVHLSGPNGVGKSAILLLVHLLCMARRLLAVYIPQSESLVNAARRQDGGDAYILEALWQQNADLIIENAALRRVFIDALLDVEKPFTPDVMAQLRKAVGVPSCLGLAVLMDEVQHISDEVKASKLSAAPSNVLAAGRYFAVNWHDWTNANSRFQRMSAASAHADRLPDGENHRLRIIDPLDAEDRDALQADPASPAYVHDAAARVYVVRIAGAVLRRLVQCAVLLPRDRSPTKDELQKLWQTMWAHMRSNCDGWLASLPEGERDSAASQVMDLLSDHVQWGSATVLLDKGIVFRSSSSSPYVKPVSVVASAVLLRVTSAYNIARRVRTSSIADGRQRGFELERQVLARIDGFLSNHGVPSKRLDGTATSAVDLHCSYSLPFRDLDEVLAQDVSVLFCPISLKYPCDAILMPAAGMGNVVHLIECSITDPTEVNRVTKVGNYFRPGGVAEQLQARGYEVIVVVCHDSNLAVRQTLSGDAIAISAGLVPSILPPSHAAAASTPASAVQSNTSKKTLRKLTTGLGDAVRVVDAQSLVRPLGVLV